MHKMRITIGLFTIYIYRTAFRGGSAAFPFALVNIHPPSPLRCLRTCIVGIVSGLKMHHKWSQVLQNWKIKSWLGIPTAPTTPPPLKVPEQLFLPKNLILNTALIYITQQCTYKLNVPAWKLLQSPLIYEVNNGLRSRVLIINVAQPALNLIRMSQYILLIRKVTLFLSKRNPVGVL